MRFILAVVCAIFSSGCSKIILPELFHIGDKPHTVTLPPNTQEVLDPTKPRLPEIVVEITPEVRRELKFFEPFKEKYISTTLERCREFKQLMVDILDEEGLPPDLIHLAVIESGMNPNARSSMGAVGLWQFMPTTARAYGLVVNAKQDDRKNPELSTRAAAKMLRDLYNDFGNWYFALSAYNAGPAGVRRAIKRAGKQDFWGVVRSGVLRRETAQFVPRFLAVSILMNSPDFDSQVLLAELSK